MATAGTPRIRKHCLNKLFIIYNVERFPDDAPACTFFFFFFLWSYCSSHYSMKYSEPSTTLFSPKSYLYQLEKKEEKNFLRAHFMSVLKMLVISSALVNEAETCLYKNGLNSTTWLRHF